VGRFSGESQWLILVDLVCSSIKIFEGRRDKGLKGKGESGHLISAQIQALSTEKTERTEWQAANKNCQLNIFLCGMRFRRLLTTSMDMTRGSILTSKLVVNATMC
jgi:hypothetical protein